MASAKEFGDITISLIGDVILMRMHGGDKNQSVFNPPFFKMFNNALDYAEKLGKYVFIYVFIDLLLNNI